MFIIVEHARSGTNKKPGSTSERFNVLETTPRIDSSSRKPVACYWLESLVLKDAFSVYVASFHCGLYAKGRITSLLSCRVVRG